MSDQSYLPEKTQVRRAFARAAADYDAAAVLQREVATRLEGRLDLIRQVPARVLDVGAGTGLATRDLMKRYPKAQVTALDIAPPMLRLARRRAPLFRRMPCVCADAEALPFRPDSFDLLFSNLTIQWCHDLDRVFQGFLRVLAPGGLLMFTTYGPDTLRELRQAWAGVDGYNHVNAFYDMHDIGDALVRAGFADPVMDVETFTLTYRSVRDLMRDLKQIGAHNVTTGRPRGLTGRGRMQAVEQAYEAHRMVDGRLPASYEVVYGHAWVPPQKPQRRGDDGVVRVPISRIGRRGP